VRPGFSGTGYSSAEGAAQGSTLGAYLSIQGEIRAKELAGESKIFEF
jgi:hypothetical protein